MAKKAAEKAETKKAAPAKSNKKAAEPVDEEPDLLSGMADDVTEGDEELDLLDEITEDDGTPWMPADDEDQPTGIQGTVTFIDEIETDQKYGGGMVPLIQIDDKKNGIEWSVRGYHTVLRKQIKKADPRVGDLIAIKYLGEKEGRDQSYQNYKVKIRHNG